MQVRRRYGAKRKWGYLVWVGAALMIAVPEITAAISHGALGFITISETIGHLERRHTWVELGVIAAIVLIVYSLIRLSPQQAGAPAAAGSATRTTGGRLTFHPTAGSTRPPQDFDDDLAPVIFVVAAVAALAVVAVGAWAASMWWDDAHRYHVSYVIYIPLALLWLVIPNLVAVFAGADVPFPTMVRSVQNLEDWLKNRSWPWALGPKAAWVATYVIFWGLVTLLIHLLLYPFPDITHILNPRGY